VPGFGLAATLGWSDQALDDVARTRGWTEDAIERLELGWDGRALIPVRDGAGDDVGELRYDPTGETQPKMYATAGTPRQLFPPPEQITDLEVGDPPTLWLVEGEPDAIRLWSLGIPAVAVPGAQNWQDRWAARFTGRHLRVIVCFDCDNTGRTNAARAAAAIVRAGVDAALVELDADRDDGYDLTDWSANATTAEDRAQARQLLQAIAERTPSYEPPPATETEAAPSTDGQVAGERPWRSITWSTFRDTSPPAHKWLVDGLLPAGVLCFVAGPPKRGKTWVGLGIAIAIALGRPLAPEPDTGQDEPFAGFAIPHARDVLYVALEGSQTGLRTRIGALARGYGVDPDADQLERLHMLYRPRPFDLAELAGAAWLVQEADELDAALVVVDVLRAAARFDENAAADFAKIRDRLDPLLALERTVMLAHHFGKLTDTQKERSPGERMAGTGAMYGALDVGLLITKSEDGARRLRVDVEARDFAAPDALGLVIDGDGTGKHGGFTYADTATLVTDATAAAARDVAGEVEKLLLKDLRWRIPAEVALSQKGGIGVSLDELRDAIMPPLCTPPPEAPEAPTRFVRLATGPKPGVLGRDGKQRASAAMPYGTWAMYMALPEPRPTRLFGTDSDGSVPESDRTDSGTDSAQVGPPEDQLELTRGTDSPPPGVESAESVPRAGSSSDDDEPT
jgi:RecA-family ATPase